MASAHAPEIHRCYFIEEDGSTSSPARLQPEEPKKQHQHAYTTNLVAIHAWHHLPLQGIRPKLGMKPKNQQRNY
jgi:hypothetical protein